MHHAMEHGIVPHQSDLDVEHGSDAYRLLVIGCQYPAMEPFLRKVKVLAELRRIMMDERKKRDL